MAVQKTLQRQRYDTTDKLQMTYASPGIPAKRFLNTTLARLAPGSLYVFHIKRDTQQREQRTPHHKDFFDEHS